MPATTISQMKHDARLVSPMMPAVKASSSTPSSGRMKKIRKISADVADALAFALRFQGRKRVHNADEFMSVIVAERLVEHLERSGFVIMKKPPLCGGSALGRGFEGDR